MPQNILALIASQAKAGPPELPMGMTPEQRSEFLRNIVEDIRSGRVPNPAETEKPGFRPRNLPPAPFEPRPTAASGPPPDGRIMNVPRGQPPINNAPQVNIQPQYPLKYAAPGPPEATRADRVLKATLDFIGRKLTAPQVPGKPGISLGSGGLILNIVKQIAAKSPLGVAVSVLANDAREIVAGVPMERRLINRPFYDQSRFEGNTFLQDLAPVLFGLSQEYYDSLEPPATPLTDADIAQIILDKLQDDLAENPPEIPALAHVEQAKTRMIGILEWTDP